MTGYSLDGSRSGILLDGYGSEGFRSGVLVYGYGFDGFISNHRRPQLSFFGARRGNVLVHGFNLTVLSRTIGGTCFVRIRQGGVLGDSDDLISNRWYLLILFICFVFSGFVEEAFLLITGLKVSSLSTCGT